ncbi:SDR family oxidoreductase [Deinococcus aestuarii]|uniref:SDR family oxidoreductase n=1 Tax=Deinococcus aestuarii TaxID=2774531 RepID=UPI001C0CE873|nr:SDR family oxidoreductase [Deinococcus aestuarii]
MIIVTGATGQLGRAIVEQLTARLPATQVGASVRDPEKAADLEALGVRVRQGDFRDPASLTHAFEGATQVLMVSSNARAYGGDPLAQHRAAIGAAREAGATRIVYTSQMAASPSSAFAPALDHAATEELLRQSGLAWTALRNGFHATSSLFMLGDSLDTGLFEAPADGPVAWTTHADLAEGAAAILTDPGRFEGPTPPLTGSQALDFADLTGLASEVLGRPVERRVISDEDFSARMAARGAPGNHLLGMYRASRAGEFATVDGALEQLIGRPALTMRDVLAQKFGR